MKTKSKTTAVILALFLGDIGIHKFYLGQAGQGIIYLLLCWTFIPVILAIIDIIIYLTMSEESFQAKYGSGNVASQQQMYQQPYHQPQNKEPQNKTAVSELLDYKKLLDSGVITQEEFNKMKEEILKKL